VFGGWGRNQLQDLTPWMTPVGWKPSVDGLQPWPGQAPFAVIHGVLLYVRHVALAGTGVGQLSGGPIHCRSLTTRGARRRGALCRPVSELLPIGDVCESQVTAESGSYLLSS
jgi:hypothetical protein